MSNQYLNFSPERHLGFLTNRVGRLISSMLAERLKQEGYDFPVQCVGILADLWSKDGLTQTELGMSVIKSKSSINSMLEQLEQQQLVVKHADDKDKRIKRIYLTNKGKELTLLVTKFSEELQGFFTDNIDKETLESTNKALWSIYNSLLTQFYNSNK